MKYLPLIGRIIFSISFLMAGFTHFMPQSIAYAASKGTPMPNVIVPASGILALTGGLSIVLGYKAKLGAWLLILFLIPVTFIMHNFWMVTDPMQQQIGMAFFIKNLAMIGAALLIAYFGAGPVSIDAMKK
jgi:putative oxidoreductase